MSENKDSTEDSGSEGDAVQAPEIPAEKPAAVSPEVNQPAAAPAGGDQPAKSGSSAVAWLALLLVLGVAAALAWGAMELQRKELTISARLAELEALAAAEDTDLTALTTQWEKQLAGLESKWARADIK